MSTMVDAVQQRFIEALARRCSQQPPGETKRLLEQRLVQWSAGQGPAGESFENGLARDGASVEAKSALRASSSALAELVCRLQDASGTPDARHASTDTTPATPAVAELKTVSHFRQAWLQLSADRRLAESLSEAPANAGPLNSERLVQRALLLMRELSPEYLQRFLQYAEGLRWLDTATGGAIGEPREGPTQAKPPRTKPRGR
jgi:hypothetical protein